MTEEQYNEILRTLDIVLSNQTKLFNRIELVREKAEVSISNELLLLNNIAKIEKEVAAVKRKIMD